MKLSKKITYSCKVIAKAIGITDAAVLYRARKLGLVSNRAGYTAEQAAQIRDYAAAYKKNKRGSVDELLAELENI